MTRSRWMVLVAIAVAITGGSALHRQWPARTSKRQAERTTAVAGPATSSLPPSHNQFPPRVTREAIAADPQRSARDWSELAARAIETKNARDVGNVAARLLRLPPTQAWQQLTARARNGDAGAATAAFLIANDCNAAGMLASVDAAQRAAYVNRLVAGLPEEWNRFLHALDRDVQQRQSDRIADCEGVGGTMDFVAMAIDRFFSATDPQIQIDSSLDNPDDAQAIADLRHLSDELHDTRSQRALGARLLRSHDIAERAQGRTILEELARTGDAEATVLLAVDQAIRPGPRPTVRSGAMTGSRARQVSAAGHCSTRTSAI